MGNQHPSITPYETLRCADAPLAVACGNDGQFRRLAQVIGASELAGDPRFATNPQRVAHRAELVTALEQQMGVAAAAEWEERCTAAGVPAGRIEDIGAAIARSASLGLDPLVDLGGDHAPQVRHPIRYLQAQTARPSPPPTLGEHDTIIRAWLAAPDRPPLERRHETERGRPVEHSLPRRHRRDLRSAGHLVRDEDVARLSPLGHAHLNCLGRYAFTSQPPTELRLLRDPAARDGEDDDV